MWDPAWPHPGQERAGDTWAVWSPFDQYLEDGGLASEILIFVPDEAESHGQPRPRQPPVRPQGERRSLSCRNEASERNCVSVSLEKGQHKVNNKTVQLDIEMAFKGNWPTTSEPPAKI